MIGMIARIARCQLFEVVVETFEEDLGVSLNSGTSKTPQNDHF